MIADTKAEGEFCRSMKPLQTLKNTGMGYSAAYPTGAVEALLRREASPKASPKGPQGAARGALSFLGARG